MAINRRTFLSYTSSLTLMPLAGCISSSEKPLLIGTARSGPQQWVVAAVDTDGHHHYQIPLPERGHGTALNQDRTLAITVARRPGQFAVVFDPRTGDQHYWLKPEPGHQFMGHGCFHQGQLWLTAKREHDSGSLLYQYSLQGQRQNIIDLPGQGPHELLSNEDALMIAVGGIHTIGRDSVNLDAMDPCLLRYNTTNQTVTWDCRVNDHQLSIRHLSVAPTGETVMAMQYQGDKQNIIPLLAIAEPNGELRYLQGNQDQWRQFNQYIGSVSVWQNRVVASSPRGHRVGYWSLKTGEYIGADYIPDVCALATSNEQLYAGSGTGYMSHLALASQAKKIRTEFTWDNHWTML